MSFDWANYLLLANELFRSKDKLPSEEACMRAAISRSYYSAHCTARNHARDREGFTPSRTGEDHINVIRHFLGAGDHKRKKIGAELDRLRIDRGKADYHDNVSSLNSLTTVSLSRAKQVLDTIRRL
jgi:hypothetical protein